MGIMDNLNELTKAHLKLAEEFLYKRINEEVYIKRRGNYKKWEEAEFLAKDSRMFSRLLQQLRRVFRVNLMRELNELDISDIIMMITQGITKSNSSISKYFTYEPNKMEQESRSQRIGQLAIILDIPYIFALQDTCNVFQENENFTEYKITNLDVIPKETIAEYTSPVLFREITGIGIINRQSLFPFLTDIVFARIDRRKSFFTIEFFIREGIEMLPYDILNEMNRSLKLKGIQTALLTTAFLRKGYKKLILVCAYSGQVPAELHRYVENIKQRKQTLEFNL
jgi:hypothetical protein